MRTSVSYLSVMVGSGLLLSCAQLLTPPQTLDPSPATYTMRPLPYEPTPLAQEAPGLRSAPQIVAPDSTAAAQRHQLLAKDWSPAIVEAILAKRVLAGMTPEQVTAARGRPDRRLIERFTAEPIAYWYYFQGENGLDVVRFRNGLVERVQAQTIE